MKKIIFILGIIVLTINCGSSNNQTISNLQNSIIGTWNMIEVYEDYGQVNPQWEKFTIGFDYTFNTDGTFYSNRFNCDNGTYILKNDNYVTVNLNCSGNQLHLPHKFTFENGLLIITLDSKDCDEGCPGEKFKRIN
jgi:hypothetical protein